MHTGHLALTPEDPYLLPQSLERILACARKIGCIGEKMVDGENRYLMGKKFMQLVTFIGCSPFSRLEPRNANQPFCHLVIEGPSEHPRLQLGRNTTPPRCAVCRKRLAECPHCGHRQDPATYDFRQTGGYGQLFLSVENIFPQEAIPSPELMQQLRADSGNRTWHCFYLQDGRGISGIMRFISRHERTHQHVRATLYIGTGPSIRNKLHCFQNGAWCWIYST